MTFGSANMAREHDAIKVNRPRHCEEPKRVEGRPSFDALMATRQSSGRRAPYVLRIASPRLLDCLPPGFDQGVAMTGLIRLQITLP